MYNSTAWTPLVGGLEEKMSVKMVSNSLRATEKRGRALSRQLPSATPQAVMRCSGLIYGPILKQLCDNLQVSTLCADWVMELPSKGPPRKT